MTSTRGRSGRRVSAARGFMLAVGLTLALSVPPGPLVPGIPVPGALVPATLSAGPVPDTAADLERMDPERIASRLADPDTRTEAGAELLLWIRELPPERASLWLHLAVAIERLPPDQVGAAAHAVLRSDPAIERTAAGRLAAARGLRDQALALPAAERPVLLALAAHLLEPEAPGEALALRRRYLAGEFAGPEAAEVVVAVARALLGSPAASGSASGRASGRASGVVEEAPADEARRILEDFLEDEPEHSLAPEARRLHALAVRAGGGAP